ncbi:MAG: hypothetical protein ACRDZ8_12885 [Acidimicrobiales bacterium]
MTAFSHPSDCLMSGTTAAPALAVAAVAHHTTTSVATGAQCVLARRQDRSRLLAEGIDGGVESRPTGLQVVRQALKPVGVGIGTAWGVGPRRPGPGGGGHVDLGHGRRLKARWYRRHQAPACSRSLAGFDGGGFGLGGFVLQAGDLRLGPSFRGLVERRDPAADGAVAVAVRPVVADGGGEQARQLPGAVGLGAGDRQQTVGRHSKGGDGGAYLVGTGDGKVRLAVQPGCGRVCMKHGGVERRLAGGLEVPFLAREGAGGPGRRRSPRPSAGSVPVPTWPFS